MGISYDNRGLSGRRLYVAVAAWLVLVLVGGFCTWYGWFGPGGESSPVEAGLHSTTFSSSTLQPGTYLLVLDLPDVGERQRILLMVE